MVTSSIDLLKKKFVFRSFQFTLKLCCTSFTWMTSTFHCRTMLRTRRTTQVMSKDLSRHIFWLDVSRNEQRPVSTNGINERLKPNPFQSMLDPRSVSPTHYDVWTVRQSASEWTETIDLCLGLLRSTDKVSQSPSTPKRNGNDQISERSINERSFPQEFPLCSSTAKKTSAVRNRTYSFNQSNNQLNDDPDRAFPPPPPSFLFDHPTSNNEPPPIIRATGPGLSDGLVDEQRISTPLSSVLPSLDFFHLGHFDLNAPNAELQKLVIAIDGPSKADIQIEIVETGIYRVFYTCQTAGQTLFHRERIPIDRFGACSGNYHISLTYDGVHISGSPYQLRLRSPPIQEQVVPPTLPPPMSSPVATIEPTEFYVRLHLRMFLRHWTIVRIGE